MIYLVMACVVGLLGGFGSVSRGAMFQRTSGTVILGFCFFAEIALSVLAGLSMGWLWGVATFFLSWLICGHLGAAVFRATDRCLPMR
jgi:hypothetical protein